MKAEKIVNRRAWFRSIRPGETSIGQFTYYKELKSISVQLADYNAGDAKRNGVFVHAKYDRNKLIVILAGVTLEQREKELTDPEYKDEWRKLIDKDA